MKIYKHNLRAAKSSLEMLREKNKACIIHSTGTGKSYIALYIMKHFNNKRIAYFAPNEYILNQSRSLFEENGIDMKYVTMMTYMSLSNQLVKYNKDLEFDLIIFDEFHRCGASYFEKGVKKLLKINSNAKIFGMSATPIRTLDKSRNMAEELFDGNVASVLSLSEAIETKILPRPRYVVGMYTYLDELEKLKRKSEKLNSNASNTKEKITRLIEQLENAKGLEAIFKENIKVVNGKYIVFTKSIEHLNKIKDEIIQKLKTVNNNINAYVVHSKNSTSNKEFETFKEDSSDSLKLLFVVDMLNEGFHLKSISGVILLRPTKSFRVYNQQIGRAFQAGIDSESIILDLVNNFDSINMSKFIQEERRNVYFRNFFNRNQEGEFSFTIVDEIRHIQELFEKAYMDIFVSKQDKVNLLLEFKKEFKREPKKREIYKDIKIGDFLERIRRGLIVLEHDDKEKLEKAGFILKTNVNEIRIHNKVLLLIEFFENFKREPYSTEVYKGEKIGSFLRTIKKSQTVLSCEDRLLLSQKGINVLSKSKTIRKNVKTLAEFYLKFKRDPHGREEYNGIKLYNFLNAIRKGDMILNEIEIEYLNKTGIRLNYITKEEEIHNKVLLLVDFVKINGRDPRDSDKCNNVNLYQFLRRIRSGDVILSSDDKKTLKDNNIRLTLLDKDEKKQKKVLLLKEFYETFKRKPKKREVYMGELIGEFERNIRRGKVKLTKAQTKILKDYL